MIRLTMFDQREEKIVEFLKTYLIRSPSHDFAHYLIAAKYVDLLQRTYGGNRKIAKAAILTHDLAREEKISGPQHAVRSAEIARPLLLASGYSTEEVEEISGAIIAHDSGNFPTIEAKIVHDGDRLAGIGALGVIRIVQYCTEMGLGMNEIQQKIEKDMKKRIEDLNFPLSLEIAKKRYEGVEIFLKNLKSELDF